MNSIYDREKLLMEARTFVLLSLFLLFGLARSYPEPVGDPIPAIQGLVSRILGENYVDKFDYEVISSSDGKDVFEIDANPLDKKPILRGNNGVSLASALNFYLKYSCICIVGCNCRLGSAEFVVCYALVERRIGNLYLEFWRIAAFKAKDHLITGGNYLFSFV